MANWTKVNKSTFEAHLDLYREEFEVRSRSFEEDRVYFIGDGHAQDEQWVGKVRLGSEEYYIALDKP